MSLSLAATDEVNVGKVGFEDISFLTKSKEDEHPSSTFKSALNLFPVDITLQKTYYHLSYTNVCR